MSSPSKLPSDDPSRRRKILCIDDQPDGLAIRKLFLETFGFDVVLARSGPEGLRILKDTALDGVLLDYRMPGMDGAAVAAQIRRLRPELPVVMLSGYVAEIPKNIHNLVNAFVSKGSPPAELIAALDKALGPGEKKPPGRSISTLLEQTQERIERSRELTARNRAQLRSIEKFRKR